MLFLQADEERELDFKHVLIPLAACLEHEQTTCVWQPCQLTSSFDLQHWYSVSFQPTRPLMLCDPWW